MSKDNDNAVSVHAPESPMINTLITCSASGRILAADEADTRRGCGAVREDDNDKTSGGARIACAFVPLERPNRAKKGQPRCMRIMV